MVVATSCGAAVVMVSGRAARTETGSVAKSAGTFVG